MALSSSPVRAQAEVEVTVVRVTARIAHTYLTITRPGGKQEEVRYELKSTFDTQADGIGSASILPFIHKKQ